MSESVYLSVALSLGTGRKDVKYFHSVLCRELWVNGWSECVKQEVDGKSLALFLRINEMQLYI